jgi:hypothetical protein
MAYHTQKKVLPTESLLLPFQQDFSVLVLLDEIFFSSLDRRKGPCRGKEVRPSTPANLARYLLPLGHDYH